MDVLTECPACATPVQAGDLFCEACGHELSAAAPAPQAVAVERWLSDSDLAKTCSACGSSAFGGEGFCEGCGQRRQTAKDHTELDLGVVAGVTDRGNHHQRNEDAMAIAVAGRTIVGLVCDGVSSSTRPDAGSHAAVDAAMPAMLAALERGGNVKPPTGDATQAAPGSAAWAAIGAGARAAQAAITLVAGPQPGPNPPSCTFVCAIVTPDAVTVGWVGDSRAYWLPDDGQPERLVVDDSLAGRLAAQGVDARVIAENPQGAALVRWLGADATDTDPHLHEFTPSGPGRVIVCSDGLHRYRQAAADLAASTPAGSPLEIAQALVRLALDAGGQDNVSVVLIPYPPSEGST